ncbi:cc503933-9660-4971-b5cd-e92d5d31bb35 [Sclerotinia trifoliorum]|uniref:Single-stranded DNA-binding protein n=1 Tax=Sclerotinia trifoliorum TaxID=28548 RepID=A0A8H2VZK0_9HELO|nr:cc503933-9660-4971-b5cd-e92d5d31bb35 [Sclerotinia trifoliorum]
MFALRRNIPSTLSRNFSTSARNNSFAKLTLVGRLADKPEVTATSQGQEIMKYAIGTSSGRGENQKTSWFRVVSFMQEGPQRDFISSLEKGTLVYVEAEATMNTYQDAEGKNKSAMNAVQQRLEVLQFKRPQEGTE